MSDIITHTINKRNPVVIQYTLMPDDSYTVSCSKAGAETITYHNQLIPRPTRTFSAIYCSRYKSDLIAKGLRNAPKKKKKVILAFGKEFTKASEAGRYSAIASYMLSRGHYPKLQQALLKKDEPINP